MHITECASKKRKHVTVRVLDKEDIKKITKKEYFFDWKVAKKNTEVYKLCLTNDESTIGLVALVDTPTDRRIEVKLLASSLKNVGAGKVYDGIAVCLIAFACREALVKYGDLACVSLLPKTELKQHYMKKYGMLDGGRQVYLEGTELMDLIKKYPL